MLAMLSDPFLCAVFAMRMLGVAAPGATLDLLICSGTDGTASHRMTCPWPSDQACIRGLARAHTIKIDIPTAIPDNVRRLPDPASRAATQYFLSPQPCHSVCDSVRPAACSLASKHSAGQTAPQSVYLNLLTTSSAAAGASEKGPTGSGCDPGPATWLHAWGVKEEADGDPGGIRPASPPPPPSPMWHSAPSSPQPMYPPGLQGQPSDGARF